MAENYDQMRRDAIHRAQEMQRRAQVQNGGRRPPPGYSGNAMAGGGTPKKQTTAQSKLAPEPERPPEPKPSPESKAERSTVPAKPQGTQMPASAPAFFDTLFADKERNLVLGLFLILMEEKSTDPSLLFALLYLLL